MLQAFIAFLQALFGGKKKPAPASPPVLKPPVINRRMEPKKEPLPDPAFPPSPAPPIVDQGVPAVPAQKEPEKEPVPQGPLTIVEKLKLKIPLTLEDFRGDPAALSFEAMEDLARRRKLDPMAVQAVVNIEAPLKRGFDPATKLPIILYEGHQFGERTDYRFNLSHPHLSWTKWKERPYKVTQAERYAQLMEALKLDANAALESCSWGLFQVMGFNYFSLRCANAAEFVDKIKTSEIAQLAAFENYVVGRKLLSALREKRWVDFALYNGTGQQARYGRLLEKEYARLTAAGAA